MTGLSAIAAAQAKLLANQPVRTIIDVGAYDGDTAAIYLRIFPDAIVHALEPDAENFAKLTESAASLRNIRPHRLAAGATDGPAVLHRNGNQQTHSLLPRPREGKRYYPENAGPTGTEIVPVVTLDSFCRDQAINFVDILKLDVQGAEVQALNGAAGLLAAGRIAVVCSEVAFVPHYQGHPMLPDLWAFLARFGYSPYDMHACLYGTDGQLRYADALFVSPEFRRSVVDPMTREP
jgi:FkbM family methyltransferase